MKVLRTFGTKPPREQHRAGRPSSNTAVGMPGTLVERIERQGSKPVISLKQFDSASRRDLSTAS